MLKKILLFSGILVTLVGLPALADAASTRVRGYTRKNGTYVAPHFRSAPDRSRNNNWSTSPNVNPYTGEAGRDKPSYGYEAPKRQPLGGDSGNSAFSFTPKPKKADDFLNFGQKKKAKNNPYNFGIDD